MKSLSELSVILVVILAFTVVTSVRSEYTWNGSEWVWSETSENKNPEEVPGSNNGYEGSGGGGYEDDMDDNFDDEYNIEEEGSGDNGPVVQDSFGPNSGSNYNSNSNSNYNTNNYNQENSYNNNNRNPENNGFQEPYDPYVNQAGQDLGNRGGGQSNNNNFQTTKTPFNNPEINGGDDIYVDPPVTPTTTTPAPRDPSIRPKNPSRPTSFFAQPGTLAAVIGGAVVGLLCAILCVMFVVYRMRKKDEGSYALDEPKRSPTVNAYAKHPSREFYA